MSLTIREAAPDEIDALIPLLLLAEPSERALQWGLENLSDAVYRMDDDGVPVAAATMRWKGHPCELHEIGVDPSRQGQGLGRMLVGWLLDEGRRRGKRAMVVGTTNTAIGNILFYQKCGFRMDAVRKDYFWYYRPPRFESGVRVLDMLLLRCELEPAPRASRRTPR